MNAAGRSSNTGGRNARGAERSLGNRKRSSSSIGRATGSVPRGSSSSGIPAPSRRSQSNTSVRSSCVPVQKSKRSSSCGSDVRTETRPISDVHYKKKCASELHDFLLSEGYPTLPKSIYQLSTREYFNVFSFLVQFIIKGYQPRGKAEEEIPRIMRYLSYPFNVTKSQVQTAGAPHTWPAMLALLYWLLQVVKAAKDIDFPELVWPDDFSDDIQTLKLRVPHVALTYRMWLMEMVEEYPDQEEEFRQACTDIHGVVSVEEAESENTRLRRELEMMQQSRSGLYSLRDDKAKLEEHIKKCVDFAAPLEIHYDTLMKEKSEVQMKVREREETLSALAGEFERLESDIAAQHISQKDVARIVASKKDVDAQLAAQRADTERVESDCWNLELSRAKGHEEVNKLRTEFNQRVLALDTTQPDFNNETMVISANMLDSVSIETARPQLTMQAAQVSDYLHAAKLERLNVTNQLHQLEEVKVQKEQSHERQKGQIAKAAADLQADIEAWRDVEANTYDDTVELAGEAERVKADVGFMTTSLTEAGKSLADKKKELESLCDSVKVSGNNMAAFLVEASGQARDFIMENRKNAKDVTQQLQSLCDRLQAEVDNMD